VLERWGLATADIPSGNYFSFDANYFRFLHRL
jgi:hypothetical protein